MNSLLKYIPGFRSDKKWKKIIASIYYILSLIMLASGIGMFLFTVSLPFIVFYGIKAFNTRKSQSIIILIAAVIICSLGLGLTPKTDIKTNNTSVTAKAAGSASSSVKKEVSNKKAAVTDNKTVNAKANTLNGQLKIHYIDVGQGDSELIQENGQNMLIDTGTNESANSLVSYLHSQNIKKIDYLVLTHPHEDHIGGADAVVKNFDIGTIYMNNKSTNTKTYRDTLSAISEKGLKINSPVLGTTFKVGDADCIIYGPVNPNDKDLNTYSIVIKLTFGKNKFLFTGDAQISNEEGMIKNGYDLAADVLKVGHHGSHTSTSQEFLNAVNPRYAVISVGKGNDYGHPHAETMDRLKAKGVIVYRTDEAGTIVCTSDGNNISFTGNKGDYSSGGTVKNASGESSSNINTVPAAQSSAPSVQQPAVQQSAAPAANSGASSETEYVDANGNGLIKGNISASGEKIYHLPGDRYYNKTKAEAYFKTESEAKAAGFRPIKN